jgi:hypothetical protein
MNFSVSILLALYFVRIPILDAPTVILKHANGEDSSMVDALLSNRLPYLVPRIPTKEAEGLR